MAISVKKQIRTTMKKFKFDELESVVFPVFPEFSWSALRSKLYKNHQSLTTVHVIDLLQEDLNKAKLNNTILEDRLGVLNVLYISRHYNKRFWYAYELKGDNHPDNFTLEDIQKQIKRSFTLLHMEVDIHIVQHKGFTFISVKEKPLKKQRKTVISIFFCFVMSEPFLFCSRKIVAKNILIAMTDGMGYQRCRPIKLMGRRVDSLLQMLLARKAAILQPDIMKESVPLKLTSAKTIATGFDFTQHNQREEHADNCFGKDPPIFEVLNVKYEAQEWKHKDGVERVPNAEFSVGLKFRSSNIPLLLKTLITKKIIMDPLPCYVAQLPYVGRNNLTVRDNDS